MSHLTEELVLDALRVVNDPDLHRDIVSLGFVKNVAINGGDITFQIELTTPACPVKDLLKEQAIEAVQGLPGVTSVDIEMTAQVRGHSFSADALPGVKHIVAIASGKGGVGKSTVAVNLSVALAQSGARVGLLDADVYGPSLPKMIGSERQHPAVENQRLLPIERFGLKVMSLGFILEPDAAVLWRGPLVAQTVKQLLADVEWGELDYLVVDLPPGTGDAPMTLAQTVPLTGVVIVLTPQDVAAAIAAKSIALFEKLNAPLLGIVENMSGFVCGHCGETTRIFDGTSGEEVASKFGIPFLGAIPLEASVSKAGDDGVPSLVAYPNTRQADAFRAVAGRLAQEVSISAASSVEAPLIER